MFFDEKNSRKSFFSIFSSSNFWVNGVFVAFVLGASRSICVRKVVCSHSVAVRVLYSQSFGRSSVRAAVQAVFGSCVWALCRALAWSFWKSGCWSSFSGRVILSFWVVYREGSVIDIRLGSSSKRCAVLICEQPKNNQRTAKEHLFSTKIGFQVLRRLQYSYVRVL
jgi:hypothetical protein